MSPSFVGNVALDHETTSVREPVERLTEPDKEASKVSGRPIVIPSLQREFCWDQAKIEALFDSLLRGPPIGTLLLWNVGGDDSDADSEAKYHPFNTTPIGRTSRVRPYSYERYEDFLTAREPELVEQLEERLVLYDKIS